MAETILAKLAVEVTAKATQFGAVLGQQEKALGKFTNSVTSAGNVIKGAFAALGVGLIGREIIDVTAEFQKFQAVLVNSLGSRSAANIALRDIEEFAKRTPFSVQELTSSFVKLANQGFKPTTEELRKLGDLSASTGKGFDQLTEAIIDAQVGEFERLKEFGIRAQKSGDQVKFTFKGVQTQTQFTSQAIRDYILSLGDAEGVSGSMAAISETLGGQISNLGDSWTQFLKIIGDGNKGALSGVTKLLSDILSKATDIIKTNKQVQEEIQVDAQSNILETLKDLVKTTNDLDGASVKLISSLEAEREALVDQARQFSVNDEEGLKQIEILNRKAIVINSQIQAINDYTKAENERAAAETAAAEKSKEGIGLILQIEKALKALEDQKKRSFSANEIAVFNAEIDALREKLELLNASRPLSNFGRQQLANAQQGITTNFDIPKTDLTSGSGELRVEIPPVEAPDFSAFQEAFAIIQKTYQDTGIIATNYGEQARLANELDTESRMRAADAAAEYGSIVGDALGSALSGQQSFAQTMKKLTADLLKTFLARALGGIIASAATAGGPPPVAIALAAAGVAAISAMFAKIGGGGGGGVSASISSRPQGSNVTRNNTLGGLEQRIIFEGSLVAKGNDLVYVLNNVNNKKERTG